MKIPFTKPPKQPPLRDHARPDAEVLAGFRHRLQNLEEIAEMSPLGRESNAYKRTADERQRLAICIRVYERKLGIINPKEEP